MDQITIETWISGTGKDPVTDFLTKIPSDAREKIIWDFELIEKYGIINAIKAEKLKKLRAHNLYEIRERYQKIAYRILGKIIGSKLILYNGFIKKSNKTPNKEIGLAKQRASEQSRKS